MNRIILIGNGFDLAHKLPTKYTDFVNSYWADFATHIYEKKEDSCILKPHNDEFVTATVTADNIPYSRNVLESAIDVLEEGEKLDSYAAILNVIGRYRRRGIASIGIDFSFKNKFFGHLSKKYHLQNWLDIENEYYTLLKDFLKENRFYTKQWPTVSDLNKEFCQVKNQLEKYLTDFCENKLSDIEPNEDILNNVFLGKGIESRCVALSKQEHYEKCLPAQKQKLSEMINGIIEYEDEHSEQKRLHAMMTRTPYQSNPLCNMNKEERVRFIEQMTEQFGIVADHTLVLNFNYTSTFKSLYAPELPLIQIINIHGELNNPDNPMIFGYGDELDEDYRKIENTNDPDMLDNVKSVAYGNTDNYRKLLEFLQLGHYQVLIMGHSCGNSDRTLLNEIFENQNCMSVKLFYHKKSDGTDDFSNVYKNISRNFNNKRALRDIVVNKTFCESLPQNETTEKHE